jgi:hypothetical protein
MTVKPDETRARRSGRVPPDEPGADPFAAFLRRRRVSVLDVLPGASADTRRLLVGDADAGTVSYAVAVGNHRTSTGVEIEAAVLGGLPGQLRPALADTVPVVVERVQVDANRPALVLTAVPGLSPSVNRSPPATRSVLAAVDAWLGAVWEDTAGERGPADLGGDATAALLRRYGASARLAPTLDAIRQSRARLAEETVPTTLTHGCLCLRHVCAGDTAVVGVDDWSLGSLASDPLRDLGRFAVQVAGGRLAEVVAGRSSLAAQLRRFVTSGLERVGLPRRLWREVLVMAQLEIALEALDEGDSDGMALLGSTVQALPPRDSDG